MGLSNRRQLTGTWNMIKGGSRASMFKHGGRILNITMTTGRGYPGMATSVAARSGVEYDQNAGSGMGKARNKDPTAFSLGLSPAQA